MLCGDIRSEFARLGGDFVVSFCLYTVEMREFVREQLKDLDLVFVVLNGSPSLNAERLKLRLENQAKATGTEAASRAGDEKGADRTLGFEPATPDEENTMGIDLAPEMTPDNVASIILKRLE